MNAGIQIIQGDITLQTTDAIVNAANNALCGGGGVDGAIHRAAGPQLLAECKTLGGCETGRAKATRGYNLKSQYVIHTVGPVWSGGDFREEELLARCYASCLQVAETLGVKSISFPAISCGAYRFPIPLAARIARQSIESELPKTAIESVFLVIFDEKTHSLFERALKSAP